MVEFAVGFVENGCISCINPIRFYAYMLTSAIGAESTFLKYRVSTSSTNRDFLRVASPQEEGLIERQHSVGGAFEAPSAACLQMMQEGAAAKLREGSFRACQTSN